MLKLNLGCGSDYLSGWVNIDAYADARVDYRYDIKKLPYDDNSVDEIRVYHVIEHMDFHEGNASLREWYRALKPGGRLHLETPDFLASCQEFVNANEEYRVFLYGHFFSEAWIPGQIHKFLFTEIQLKTQLQWVGFTNIKRLEADSHYTNHYPKHIFLNMESFKP
jgi:ubiquinone/menaquinone biosynthesis C-methylase UbiE